jgi:hypothetical protein
MIALRPIGLGTAEALIDFGGRNEAARAFAPDQLEGAVALHNLLADQGFAYLADEVGMGKTYVALGVVSLMRHFHPDLRVLYMAPRSNIQAKWRKEMRNFVANNWRVADLRVKSLQDAPVVDMVVCNSLEELAQEAHANAHRDFVLRMPSFSLQLRDDEESWQKKRRQLRRLLGWLPDGVFDLRNRQGFKESYARAINAALPHFDLLVVDEAHNLRHGYAGGSTRNRLLGLVLGREDEDVPLFPGGGPRVDRVLALSATPLETDYRELWQQLDLLGKGEVGRSLIEPEIAPEVQQQATQGFMVRRLTGLKLGEKRYTKNMYRREWRRGGVELHGEPLKTSDPRERLVVALVQKKVTDVLAELGRRSGKIFGRRFQMGMLASFESFLETAKLARGDDEPAFDQADQTDDELEREGVDAMSIADVARSYRERFGDSLPHPKMNAVAKSLAASLERGEKSLVFVRRVASVRELVQKVTHAYDAWLLDALVQGLPAALTRQIEREVARYRRATRTDDVEDTAIESPDDETEEVEDAVTVDADQGGSDSFFAWFFRGERELKVASGAWFRRRRLTDEKMPLSTFLEENYLDWLLGAEGRSVAGLAARLGIPQDMLRGELRRWAHAIFTGTANRKVSRGRRMFRAHQEAALRLLVTHDGELSDHARTLLGELGWTGPVDAEHEPASAFPDPDEFLGAPTLFSTLRRHALGEEVLRLDDRAPRSVPASAFRSFVRRHEIRRELVAATVSLGHPFVELWRAYVRLRGTLKLGEATDPMPGDLAEAYLGDLAAQPADRLGGREELRALLDEFDLVIDVNFPDVREKPLAAVPRYLQSTLSAQRPVGGMSGQTKVNQSLIKQFRMPGYPLVLVTTDVLQEGEDLHTFASRVVHYGITWTPSAMEQRTGRIDRIGSLTHRRLTRIGAPDPERFLQVQFPYLDATVEYVQVREILRRMDRFVALLHQGLGADEAAQSAVDLARAIHEHTPIKPPSTEPLESPFAVDRSLLHDEQPVSLAIDPAEIVRYTDRFAQVRETLSTRVSVDWLPEPHRATEVGTAWLADHRLLRAGAARSSARQQPFVMKLQSTGGLVVLRVSSPVGNVSLDDEAAVEQLFRLQSRLPAAKICAVIDAKLQTYNLTVEVETPFHPDTLQDDEALSALERCVLAADRVEHELLQTDAPISVFAPDLRKDLVRG